MVTLLKRRKKDKGLGMPGDNSRILALARRLSKIIDAPAVGGIAVHLHGVRRATVDLDLYTTDRRSTAAALEAMGARWDKDNREHVLDGISIHTITPADARCTIDTVSIIDGIRVVTLKDLVAIKLYSGLKNPGRYKDLGDVESLISPVPLDKRFAARLPKDLRDEYKRLVDGVRARERGVDSGRRF